MYVNVKEKSLKYLIQTYNNNKKYKTVKKLHTKTVKKE
jgi:hypothetical protein